MRNFSEEELNYYKTELLKFKSPLITKLMTKFWFGIGKLTVLILFLSVLTFGIVYSNVSYNQAVHMWKYLWLLLIPFFGIAILILISHLSLNLKIKRESSKLNLSVEEWNYIANKFKIKI